MIIANWKMNGSKELVKQWIDFVSQNIEIDSSKECIFCPPTCYLDYSKNLIQKSSKDIKLGSQQLDYESSFSLTGGTNSHMLKDLGCEFVIIGHSEQRIYLNESNLILSDKLTKAINLNLKPIYCVGESLQQKESSQTKDILMEQLTAIPGNIIDKCIIAYEPVWAIGTGKNAEISYIKEIHIFIKEALRSQMNITDHISVVYGGSVNLENYEEIYSLNTVDGLLIGGASLDSDTFTRIYNMS